MRDIIVDFLESLGDRVLAVVIPGVLLAVSLGTFLLHYQRLFAAAVVVLCGYMLSGILLELRAGTTLPAALIPKWHHVAIPARVVVGGASIVVLIGIIALLIASVWHFLASA